MHNNNTNSENKNKNSGNNCGHRPETPRHFVPPENHENRPLILRKIIIDIQKYYQDPGTLPLLNAANESDRQQRSERREGCMAILGCILHYTDLVTLRVGIPQADGSMTGLTMDYLAEKSELSERRAERAIHDLKAAGIITVHPICKKISNAVYEGKAAIRTVSTHLFTALGRLGWLKQEQQKAIDRRKKKNKKQDQKKAAHIQMGLNALKNKSKATSPAADTVQRKGEMSSVSAFLAGARKILNPDTS
jgi:hypothetical protein